MRELDNIKVEYPVEQIDDDTVLVTAAQTAEWIERHAEMILKSALESYDGQPQSSVIPNDTTSTLNLTLDDIDTYANGLNSNKDNLITVNAIILRKILEDTFLGQAYQSVVANINTDYKLTYGTDRLGEEDADELKQVREDVDYFCQCVNLRQLIRDAMSRTYAEGNTPMIMRLNKNMEPVIDMLPLTLVYPSEYLSSGRSVMEVDVKALKDKLSKSYKKTKKNKALYFKNIEDEIKANFPDEVFEAYKASENYVRLDPRYSDCVKINDLGRRFGVSPLFRCLRPLIVLEQIEKADVSDSKARTKKILFQKLRKEALGPDGTRKGLDLAVYAHQQVATAIRSSQVVYTAAPFVESLEYVQVKNTTENTVNQQKLYTQKLLTGLGIGFTDIDATVGAANISVKQLLRIVNAIGENLETVLNKFLRTWVVDNGHDAKFAPRIRVLDAEQLEMDMRKEMASFVYNILNGPISTAYEMIGLDFDDEMTKRQLENNEGYDKIFFPRKTAYTNGGDDNTPGRPSGDDTEGRQEYDRTYSDNVRS